MASTQTIKEYLVGLGFEVNEEQLNKFNRQIVQTGVAITVMGNLVTELVGQVTNALTAFFNPKAYVHELDALNDVSDRTGIAVEDMMKLGYQAELAGSSQQALISSLESLNRSAGLAAMGMGRAQKVFEQLGISVKDANGKLKPTAGLMDEIRGKIKGMESGQQQAILSRLGLDPTLVQMMTQDMSELAAEYDYMLKQSGLNANEAAKDAGEYQDAMDKMSTAVSLLGKSYAARLFKPLTESSERMRKLIVDNMPKILDALEKVSKFVLRLFDVFSTTANRIIQVVGWMVEKYREVDDALDNWITKLGLLVIAWRVFNLAFLATPLGMILSLAAALALLAEDFYVWRQGGDSLINWAQWENEVQLVIDIFTRLYEGLVGIVTDLIEWFANAWGFVERQFNALQSLIEALVRLVTGDFVGAWHALLDALRPVIDTFRELFGWAGKVMDKVGEFVAMAGGKLKVAADATFAASGFDAMGNPTGGGFAPSPAAAATLGGMNQNITQTTEIKVEGSADPAATGRAVAGEQAGVNASMARNMAARAR